MRQKQRRFTPERNKVISDEVDRLLEIDVIEPFQYPTWLSNVVVVKKKNGKWRVYIDFTNLNKACPKDSYPLPKIDQLVDATAGYERMSFLDAYSGYNQIRMSKKDRIHTAFITERGLYCYKVMPFGLKNAGATYQRLINRMFTKHIGTKVEAYIDDMVIKSKKSKDHVSDMEEIFGIFRKFQMKLNPLKCAFGVSLGQFLGHVGSKRGIEPNPTQVKSLSAIQEPKTVRDVQSLAGKIAALGRFISRMSDRCKPFFQCIKQSASLEWGEEQNRAFRELKEYLSTSPVLSAPEDGEELFLYLAVSEVVVSGVLIKEENKKQKPVFYTSKMLLDAETRYSDLEKMVLALVTAKKKLRHYFESHPITVVTNYPIRQILSKPDLSGRLTKWAI